MSEFSLAEFAIKLVELAGLEVLELHHGLEKASALVGKKAKGKIGHYQSAVGGFPAWEELAESTKDDRVRHGYSADNPLLRDGKLRDSIGHEVGAGEAVIGSTSDIALYQELGTNRIPPRPFLGSSAVECAPKIKAILGAAAISGLLDGRAMPAQAGFLRAEDYEANI